MENALDDFFGTVGVLEHGSMNLADGRGGERLFVEALVDFVDGRAQRKPIKLGTAVTSGFIVRSGLAAGAVVVTRGNEQLSDGEAIDYGGDKGKSTPEANS